MKDLNIMSAFLKLGELTDNNETLASKVKYKEKIVFSTMRAMIPEWEAPSDWKSLTDEDKMTRLKKLEEVI